MLAKRAARGSDAARKQGAFDPAGALPADFVGTKGTEQSTRASGGSNKGRVWRAGLGANSQFMNS
jgi:hypothetical protein